MSGPNEPVHSVAVWQTIQVIATGYSDRPSIWQRIEIFWELDRSGLRVPLHILLFWPKTVGHYFTGGMYSRPKFFRYSFSGGNPTLVRRWSTCSSSSTGKRKNFPLDSALDCS